MKRALEEALARCLARMEQGAGIEDCLEGQGSLAAELRPLLEAAQTVRSQSDSIPEHTARAAQMGRVRMHAVRARQAEASGRTTWLGLLWWRPAGLVAVAAVVALLAALGFTTGLLRFDTDTSAARVEGVVSRVTPDSIVVNTDDGEVIIHIGKKTIVLDASGNPINGVEIPPGRSARVEGEEKDGEYEADRIEVEEEDEDSAGTEVEFSGVVKAVDGSSFTVQTSFGPATVHTDSQTEVIGTLAPGVTVKIHAIVQGGGSYLAREIEVKDEEDRDQGDENGHGDDGEDRQGSGEAGQTTPTSGSDGDESDSGDPDSADGDSDDDKPDDSGDGDHEDVDKDKDKD